jgi:hypothetical protein
VLNGEINEVVSDGKTSKERVLGTGRGERRGRPGEVVE